MSKTKKTYQASEVESKWYQYWLDKQYFKSVPDEREPYCIVIPPPNVTGVLHMGHMLNNTIQDVLIRRARMRGYNALWVAGTDHASIATEAKVVQKLRSEGLTKGEIGREKFLDAAWEWTHKHGGIILEQLKALGASCDWDRTRFTMEPKLYDSVIKVFVDLHQKGLIYRGERMVYWDPAAKTAVSDEEVIHKEVQSKLYYVRYQVVGTNEYLTVATTRPETIMGDTALALHPNDERYRKFHGKKVIVPLVNREVPIILDDYIDIEFGTGALKVTPAHDPNDYELGKKHKLESIEILDADGLISEAAQVMVGKDRFDARKAMEAALTEVDALVKVEDYANKVGFSERSDAVIEPRLSLQWFLKMEDFSKPALEAVMSDEVQLVPAKFKNTYRHWMENVHDWCISRQLWWGHQIPAFFYGEGTEDYVVAETAEEALELARVKTGKASLSADQLKQDSDVLDTWFSSWLWPISVFDGILEPTNEEINYYYPTRDLVTAPEILFFWVARMIIAGYEYRNEKPFSKVYLTGIVRDKQGRKMSKSLGNSPDPLELIEKYGADGVRVGMLLTSPAGNDLPFDESLCEQGRNFLNKIWNSYRLIQSWEIFDEPASEVNSQAIDWFEQRLNQALTDLEQQFEDYRISDALMTVYRLVWDDYCSWFLEAIKPKFGEAMDAETKARCVEFFESLLKILHPFTPFISEEIWQDIKERSDKDALVVSSWPEAKEFSAAKVKSFEEAQKLITEVRNLRSSKNLSPKESLSLIFTKGNGISAYREIVLKLANLKDISKGTEQPASSLSIMVGSQEYFVPFEGDLELDVEEERRKVEEELKYTQGFLFGIQKKLSNKGFVDNAPAQVVALEQKKKDDAESKIKVLEEQLTRLN
ncbi:MAG TPA: valine--tRNA ligase [Flavobacteriales bacterium]|nr:valine--tRNA ligase [Flavobacteriales bacterium]